MDQLNFRVLREAIADDLDPAVCVRTSARVRRRLHVHTELPCARAAMSHTI